MLGTIWVQRFVILVMISFFTSLCFQLFLRNQLPWRCLAQISGFETFSVKNLLNWNWFGKSRCDKSPMPEFEAKTLLKVGKKEEFLVLLCSRQVCSAKLCPPGGSVTPGEKLLTEVTFVFLSVSPPLSLKKHRSIKKRRGREKYCPRVKINSLSQVI